MLPMAAERSDINPELCHLSFRVQLQQRILQVQTSCKLISVCKFLDFLRHLYDFKLNQERRR
jgi:hypothetical protein